MTSCAAAPAAPAERSSAVTIRLCMRLIIGTLVAPSSPKAGLRQTRTARPPKSSDFSLYRAFERGPALGALPLARFLDGARLADEILLDHLGVAVLEARALARVFEVAPGLGAGEPRGRRGLADLAAAGPGGGRRGRGDEDLLAVRAARLVRLRAALQALVLPGRVVLQRGRLGRRGGRRRGGLLGRFLGPAPRRRD